ncbi:MAG: hypothetical protein HFF04_08865 [Oscillospiraceae bacterium]|nr:hypothetical protein [Oscillospiraceae bacterium]
MLISALANIILGLIGILFVFELPQFPDTVINIFNAVVSYLNDGLDLIHLFIGNTAFGVIGVVLQLVIAANAAYFIISFVWFVFKKIPFLGLKE